MGRRAGPLWAAAPPGGSASRRRGPAARPGLLAMNIDVEFHIRHNYPWARLPASVKQVPAGGQGPSCRPRGAEGGREAKCGERGGLGPDCPGEGQAAMAAGREACGGTSAGVGSACGEG